MPEFLKQCFIENVSNYLNDTSCSYKAFIWKEISGIILVLSKTYLSGKEMLVTKEKCSYPSEILHFRYWLKYVSNIKEKKIRKSFFMQKLEKFW